MNDEKFCPACGDYRAFRQESQTETYHVRGLDVKLQVPVEVCPKCGESLFDEDRDSAILEQVYSECRAKKGLLSPSEIKEIREQCGLSQEAFATLLGMSPATINRYEGGALQELTQNQAILACRNLSVVAELLDRRGHLLTPRQLGNAKKAVDAKRLSQPCDVVDGMLCLPRVSRSGELTGFRKFSYSKYAAIVSWLCLRLKSVCSTKLNKLLFYTDFLHFKLEAVSVTGSAYRKVQFGPVPENYGALADRLALDGYASVIEVEYSGGCQGQNFLPATNAESAITELAPSESMVLEIVIRELGGLTAKAISERSHKEKAWLETEDKRLILYVTAKELSLNPRSDRQ